MWRLFMDNEHQIKQDKINEERYKSRIDLSLNQLNERISQFDKIHNQLKSNMDSEILSIRIEQEKNIKGNLSIFKNHSSELDLFRSELVSLKKELKGYLDDFKKQFVNTKDLRDSLDVIVSNLGKTDSEIKNVKNVLSKMINKYVIEIESSIQAVKDSIPQVESKEDTKAREDKLNVLVMDVTNAATRAINCEKQLALIEKKLELLNVSMKSIQLRE